MDGIYLEYLEDLRKVATAEDAYFPDFLFTFLSNDFGDNYYELGMIESPLMQEVKRIKRKYSDFFDYVDALEVYREYMDLLAEKYGSVKIVKASAKEGMIGDYVPPKPKLKNTKKNRELAADGIVPSRRVAEMPEPEVLNKYASIAMPTATGDTIDESEFMRKLPKRYRKSFEEAYERAAGASRRRNMYRSTSGSNAEIDFILSFINNANHGSFNDSYVKEDDKPLTEIMKDIERERDIPPELLDDYLNPKTAVLRNGRMINREEEANVEIMTLLYEMGVDVFNAYGKDMSKNAIKMLRSATGNNGPLTKKERKKAKKAIKKENERMANKRNNDALLERTLTRNRYRFKTDGDALSFRMSDLIGRDD